MDYNKGKVMNDLLTGKKKVIRKGDLKFLPVSEKRIQMECVAEFRRLYPDLAAKGLLFRVPNELAGKRGGMQPLDATGIVQGVSDLILLVPRKGYGGVVHRNEDPNGRAESPSRNGGRRPSPKSARNMSSAGPSRTSSGRLTAI